MPDQYADNQLLAAHSRDMILFIDLVTGHILEANQCACQTYGYTRDELLTLTVHDFRAPDTRATTVEQMVVADEQGILFETEHQRKNGEVFPVEVSSRGATMAGRRTLISIIRDISERKRAEASIRESEREYRAFFNLANAGKAVYDAQDSHFLRVNPKFCEIMGYTEDELIDMCIEDIIHPEDRPKALEEYRSALESGANGWKMEKRNIRKDGQTIWVEVLGSIVRDDRGNPICNYVVVQDITERKATRNRLSYLALVLENVHDAVIATDGDGRVTAWNHAAEELYGWTEAEALGVLGRDLLHTEITEEHRNAITQRLLTGARVSFEVTQYTKTGQRLTIQGSTKGVFDAEGRIVGLVASTRDVTDKKRTDEAIRRYAHELRRSNRELEEFALVASHDLNEPLHKIEIFSSTLLSNTAHLDEKARDYLERMGSAASRMRQMVDGLLELSRINIKNRDFLPVDLSQVTAEVLSNLEIQVRRTGAQVDVQIDENGGTGEPVPLAGRGPVVEADPLQMQLLLQNLIANALKYHHPDRPPTINIRLIRLPGGPVQIVVQDDGIGFDETQAERIFWPFQRLVSKSEFEGSGMGLAISKKIVERHGGRITTRSTPGQGAIFTVELPGRIGTSKAGDPSEFLIKQ